MARMSPSQRRNIESGEPHIHDDSNLHRVVVVFELLGQLLLILFVAYDAVPEDNGGHSSMMLYVAIGAIAAIAAIGGVFLFLRKSKS